MPPNQQPLTSAEVLAIIREKHLKASLRWFHKQPGVVIHWDRAWLDPGGVIFGLGPYAKVPVTLTDNDQRVIRVHVAEPLRKRLARLWIRP